MASHLHSEAPDNFASRHIGPRNHKIPEMLNQLGFASLGELTDATLPESIRSRTKMDLPPALSETQLLNLAGRLASKNKSFRSYIGMGYHNSFTPSVILRNIMENPGWYTAYTPYQAEISQGRLEALVNFQTMVMDLTAMDMANASLLDEATAAAEAMVMCRSINKKSGNKFFIPLGVLPQTIEVLQTRAKPLGIELVTDKLENFVPGKDFFACLFQYPNVFGEVRDYSKLIAQAKSEGLLTVVACDLLALIILKAPGEMGADIAIGSSQRFGVPFGFGGPHAAFLATSKDYRRLVPGRLVGLSKDSQNQNAYRLALQTREQHIRREKATSNICTAQVLLAVMAGMYGVYHGPKGLRKIALHVHHLTSQLAVALQQLGFKLKHNEFFDTLFVEVSNEQKDRIEQAALARGINLNYFYQGLIGIALDETVDLKDLRDLISCFGENTEAHVLKSSSIQNIPAELTRQSEYLTHPVFNAHHSETEMLRYLHQLEKKDLALNHSMIPLGSCTMKLNATTEMIPVTWPKFAQIHPLVPLDQAEGYLTIIHELDLALREITGFAAFSMQPNAGSQGEYAGLLVIWQYHYSRNEGHRNICLIPQSAHGTNPASAVMAGMKVVVVKCDDCGNIDIEDLRKKATEHKSELCALMITYPSTHGVFEEGIKEICQIIHDSGGQVYLDGANLNALVGLCRPVDFGADVAHLNLHKTFCIPHGGGGPGVGPIGVAEHLREFLPTHSLIEQAGPTEGLSAVSQAPWGSAGILPISWAYLRLMGEDGLTEATQVAILNANYIASRLREHYPILYTGKDGLVAHECIIDLRGFKTSAGITVDDVAKRLMDYGFHAPTMSWPVAGTLMIEPTESESKPELDRFCEAMIAIRAEIREIETGKTDKEDNPLKNAPHTVTAIASSEWNHSYSREKAVFPLPWIKDNKYWPPVGRVDNAYGDKNFVCDCPPIESYNK